MMTYRVKRILWGLVFVAIGIGYLGTSWTGGTSPYSFPAGGPCC